MDYITNDEKKVLMDKLDRWSIVQHSKIEGQRFIVEEFDYKNLLVGIRRLLPNDKLDIRIRWVDPEDIFVIKKPITLKRFENVLKEYKKEETYGANSSRMNIKKVIFNNPATIVFWSDGSKTVVKAHLDDYDPEKGLAMAIAKKALGNEGNYYNVFKKWLPKDDETIETDQTSIGELFYNHKDNDILNKTLEDIKNSIKNRRGLL